MTNLKEEIKRLENYHKWWKFWNWGGLKKDRAKEMIETYQELIKMETKTKKIQTIKDCKTLNDIREGIDSIMDQHDIMEARVNDYELTCSSMIESLK